MWLKLLIFNNVINTLFVLGSDSVVAKPKHVQIQSRICASKVHIFPWKEKVEDIACIVGVHT